MTVKYISSFKYMLVLLCASVMMLLSCSKDSKDLEDVLMVGTDYMEVSNKDADYSFDLLTNVTYAVSADVDWIQFQQSQGEKGKQKVSFKVSKNEFEERTGVIQVYINEELNREILVVQEAGTISVFFVKPGGEGDGRSWEAATTLDNALAQATSGSVIHLTQGTYTPSKTISGGDAAEDGDRTIEIDKNIKLIGGYPTDAEEGSVPDARSYQTVFSGKLPSGAASFHVVAITAPLADQEQVELQGITIRDGNGSDRNTTIKVAGKEISRGKGAGIVISGARAILREVNVVENKTSNVRGVSGYAAGIYALSASELYIYDSHVDRNRSDANGGGLWVDESKAYIFNSTFDNNYARGTAAGVHAFPNSLLYMYNSSVSSNSGTSYGAAVYARGKSKTYLVNCLINGNKSTSPNGGGGVMLYDNCEAHIISSTITQNHISGPGGGIYRRQNTNKLTVINSIISGNEQASGSSDVDVYETDATAPIYKASIIGARTYDVSNAIISGATFNPDNMLNSSFLPIGSDNPALSHGMNASSLKEVAQQYDPELSEDVEGDYKGSSRNGKTIIGAIVE
ncbi:BACON domain-containing protein [Sphingobacterium sp. JB170]|uniref:BACON domain-containing protein n=1 Tax=Sphingobacterium sp. JB170 TaxID=1434842 RepID=UPI000B35FCE0|nr:BACON domain-containing carbohydrate-binding protein [Sphingobacterium sp. JB170]